MEPRSFTLLRTLPAVYRPCEVRALRRFRRCLVALFSLAIATRTLHPGGRSLRGSAPGTARANAFVQGLPRLHTKAGNIQLDMRSWCVAAPVLLNTGSSPAWAEDFKNDFISNAKRLFNLITRGAAEVYDPSTEEGAKALGFAYPLPKTEEYAAQQATLQDVAPILGIFVGALVWGIFVVPSLLDRSDGSKAYAFPEKTEKEKLTEDQVEESQTPLLQVKSPATTNEQLSPLLSSKKRLAPKRKKSGFSSKKS